MNTKRQLDREKQGKIDHKLPLSFSEHQKCLGVFLILVKKNQIQPFWINELFQWLVLIF